MTTDHIQFPCIKLDQPIGTFYVGAVSCLDVLAISYADIRRIEQRDIERVVGIQRELRPPRVRQIKQYVTNIDATFPTSIILAIDSANATYDPRSHLMTVTREPRVAKIIDGQHRIAGLEGFQGRFDMNVTIFLDMDLEDQAMTFATINIEQTKVNRSLVFDLYEYQKAPSPQKTCHNIARLLNSEADSPLQGRIKILGLSTGEPFEFITQATFVGKLLDYISVNPMKDRDLIKRNGKRSAASAALPKDETKLIFRELFRSDQDEKIARIVWNYFTAVARRWPTAWHSNERGDMLNRSQGFSALMRFLGPVYRAYGEKDRLSISSVSTVLSEIAFTDSHFRTENYAPGTSGESALFRDLRAQSGLE